MGMGQSLAYRQLVFLTLKEIYHTYCLHDILRHIVLRDWRTAVILFVNIG
jgi:hypothetical protein